MMRTRRRRRRRKGEGKSEVDEKIIRKKEGGLLYFQYFVCFVLFFRDRFAFQVHLPSF